MKITALEKLVNEVEDIMTKTEDKLIERCKKYDKIAARNGIHQVSFYSMLIVAEQEKMLAKLRLFLEELKSDKSEKTKNIPGTKKS